MENLTTQDLSLILTFILGSLMVMLIPTVVGIMWKIYSKNTDAVKLNTRAIVRLETHLETILKRTDEIPKIQKDLNGFHERLRIINERKADKKS